jgi:hypothetical protein
MLKPPEKGFKGSRVQGFEQNVFLMNAGFRIRPVLDTIGDPE